MNNEDIKKLDKEYVAGTYNRYDVAIEKGKGAICYDYDGKKYIDFTSGIGVNCLGYSDDGLVSAVSKQLENVQHTSNLFYTEPCASVARKMCERTGMKKMFFCNSGAEANEGAIKAARKYSEIKYNGARYEIISLKDSFHGRTMAAITATGQDSFHNHFNPLLNGFKYTDANDIKALKDIINNQTCAIMIEPIQGEGGVNVLDPAYMDSIMRICQENDILLITDEVQTGVGRTGKFMAGDHYGIKPDIMSVAKGLGGGLPIGGVLFGAKTENALLPGDHGSTFGGNPVVCAGADHIMDRIDDDFLKKVSENGEYLKERLSAMENVTEVTGMGLMLGVSINTGEPGPVVKKCIKNGLLILTAKDKLRLLPPLIIDKDLIDEGLEILQFAVK